MTTELRKKCEKLLWDIALSGEEVDESVDRLMTLIEAVGMEVIGEDREIGATDDLIIDQSVSWAVQMRLKANQRTTLLRLIGKENQHE